MADGSVVVRPRVRSAAAGVWLLAGSGFAGLGYQMVWTRQLAVWVGHEAPALLAVVAAIFGGFAIGAAALGPRIARSARPERWYAACEAAIGLWGAALLVLLPVSGAALQAALGLDPGALRQWGVSFAGATLALLPATAAMGATIPAIDRLASIELEGRASVALPYAANTGGAVLGVLAAAYGLVPAIGLNLTAAVCIGLNLGCAGMALRLLGRTGVPQPGAVGAAARTVPGGAARSAPSTSAGTAQGATERTAADAAERASPGGAGRPAHAVPAAMRGALLPAGRATLRLAATGLLGLGYEVLVVRVLAQVSEDTVYTYADLLAVYLAGSALGAALFARWRPRIVDRRRAADRLLVAVAVACLAGAATLWGADILRTGLVDAAGGGMAAAIAAEAGLAVAAFALPTVAMGALFALLCDLVATEGVGPPLAANTAGAALAPIVFGVVLAPALGAKLALLVVPLGYLALVRPGLWWTAPPWVVVAAIAIAGIAAPPLAFVQVPEGGRLVDYREGVAAAVSVVEDADRVARLRIDNRQQEGTSASRPADARQAWLPLLLHPAPRRVLFLGLGTGVTAASAAVDPALAVDAVELLPEVVAASPRFTAPILADAEATARLHVAVADARRYVQVAGERYDVIVSDNFHPARSGSASLYTVEHFAAVRARLAPEGVFCQWLPLHQLDRATLASIVRSFGVAFPDGAALLASNSLETPVIGLVGTADGHRFDPVARAGRALGFAGGPGDFGLDGMLPVFGSFVAGPRALARFAASAPLNTDDRPVVAWLAPRITYAPDSRPAERLLALLQEWRVEPDELLAPDVAGPDRARIAAYRSARDRFLAAGVGVHPSADVRRMLAQVQAPLLEALRISPDFRPAREPLRRMAAALATSDPAAAGALLEALPADPACAGAGDCRAEAGARQPDR